MMQVVIEQSRQAPNNHPPEDKAAGLAGSVLNDYTLRNAMFLFHNNIGLKDR